MATETRGATPVLAASTLEVVMVGRPGSSVSGGGSVQASHEGGASAAARDARQRGKVVAFRDEGLLRGDGGAVVPARHLHHGRVVGTIGITEEIDATIELLLQHPTAAGDFRFQR